MEEFKIVEVTPDMAKEWLRHNPNNRTIRFNVVKAYAQQMITNDWDITGQAISFDTEDKLIDGQHRLSAVIMANKPVKMLIATGLRRTFNYDNGRLRAATDSIYMATGERFTRSMIFAAGLAVRIKEGRSNSDKVMIDEQYKWLMKHQETIEQIGFMSNFKITSTAPIILAMISAYESGITAEQINGWRQVVNTGIYSMPYQETAVRFRNWYNSHYYDKNSMRAHHREICKAAQLSIQKYARKEILKNIRVPEEYIYQIK